MSAQQTSTATGTTLPWDTTIGQVLDRITEQDPHKTFVEIGGASYSYREVREGVLRTAAMFRGMGVSHGDRVCLFMPNCIEYLYCWFGLSELGAISVPINTAYRRDETAYILNNAEAVALVTDPSLVGIAVAAADLAPGILHRVLRGDDPVPDDWTSFSEAFDRAAPLDDRPEVSPDDVSMLVYTSGTTGNPKGVMVTHRMYAAAGQGFRHWTQASIERPVLHLPALLPRQHPVLLDHGRTGLRRHAGHRRPIQRLPVLGAGARGESHRGQLHRHDDAGAGQERDPA